MVVFERLLKIHTCKKDVMFSYISCAVESTVAWGVFMNRYLHTNAEE